MSARASHPPELRLILACARRAFTGTPLDLEPNALEGIDWDKLVNAAVYHKLGIILHHGTAALDPSPLPMHLRLLLASRAHKHRTLSRALTAELERLAALFDEQGIPFLAYKGAVAAGLVYVEPHVRAYRDIDLLVPVDAVEAAGDLLRDQGYNCSEPPERQQWLGESTFEHPDSPGSVDLHWSLVPGYLYIPDRLPYPFEQPRRVATDAASLPTLTAELMLLDFCLQGAKERWSSLCRAVDLAGFIHTQRDNIDWQRLRRLSDDAGLDRVLDAGLGVAAGLFPETVPMQATARVSSSRSVGELVEEAIAGFCRVEDAAQRAFPKPAESSDARPEQWWAFVSREPRAWMDFLPKLASKPADRLRVYGLVAAFNLKRLFAVQEHDRRGLPLPRVLTPLYLVIRPVRILSKYVLAPLYTRLAGAFRT